VPEERRANTRAEMQDSTKSAPKNPGVNARPVPIITEDGFEEWLIESIVDERRQGRQMQYRVRWLGYGPEEDCWLPAHDLSECQALDKWEARR
jgi:hypothetical protein